MNNLNENKIEPEEKTVEKVIPPNPIVNPADKTIINPIDKPVSVNSVVKPEINQIEKEAEKLKEEPINNKNKIYIVLGIIIGILFLIGASYVGRSITNKKDKLRDEIEKKEYNSEITLNGNTCFNLEDYFVITRDEINEPGENILVKYKTDKEKEFNCEYIVEENDFELKNIITENFATINLAQYYSFIKDNKLIVDSGTGTKREFQIYNLDTKEKIFTDNYNSGLENLDLNENILTYWRTTNDIPNKENCSRIEEYLKMGGAKIEAKISLDITDITKKEFSEFRCSYAE